LVQDNKIAHLEMCFQRRNICIKANEYNNEDKTCRILLENLFKDSLFNIYYYELMFDLINTF